MPVFMHNDKVTAVMAVMNEEPAARRIVVRPHTVVIDERDVDLWYHFALVRIAPRLGKIEGELDIMGGIEAAYLLSRAEVLAKVERRGPAGEQGLPHKIGAEAGEYLRRLVGGIDQDRCVGAVWHLRDDDIEAPDSVGGRGRDQSPGAPHLHEGADNRLVKFFGSATVGISGGVRVAKAAEHPIGPRARRRRKGPGPQKQHQVKQFGKTSVAQ